MTSTDNLISLHKHLQSMESALADFMMETILRFQNLIDMKVFFLVEDCGNGQKRRYCGTRDLIKRYESCGISKETGDSCVELNTTSPVLVEKPGDKRPLVMALQSVERDVALDDLGMWSVNDSDVILHKKVKIDADIDSFYTLPCDDHPSDCPTDQPPDRPTNERSDRSTEEPSDQPSYQPTPQVQVEKEEIDFVVATTEDEDEDEPPIDLLLPRLRAASDSKHDSEYSAARLDEALSGRGKGCSSDTPPSGFFSGLSKPHIEERKLAAILATDNPYAAYVKKTNENKVWSSVLYKVGKNLAYTCPLPEKSLRNAATRAYFSEQCETFLRHIPTLIVNKDVRPRVDKLENDCLRGCTVAGFIKQRILNGFCQTVRRTWPSESNDSRVMLLQ